MTIEKIIELLGKTISSRNDEKEILKLLTKLELNTYDKLKNFVEQKKHHHIDEKKQAEQAERAEQAVGNIIAAQIKRIGSIISLKYFNNILQMLKNAERLKYPDVCRKLASMGFNINKPLESAIQAKNPKVVAALVKGAIDFGITLEHGNTYLKNILNQHTETLQKKLSNKPITAAEKEILSILIKFNKALNVLNHGTFNNDYRFTSYENFKAIADIESFHKKYPRLQRALNIGLSILAGMTIIYPLIKLIQYGYRLSNNVIATKEANATPTTEEATDTDTDTATATAIATEKDTATATPEKQNAMINPNDTTFAAFSMFYEKGLSFGPYHQYGAVHTEAEINNAFKNIKDSSKGGEVIPPKKMRAALRI